MVSEARKVASKKSVHSPVIGEDVAIEVNSPVVDTVSEEKRRHRAREVGRRRIVTAREGVV